MNIWIIDDNKIIANSIKCIIQSLQQEYNEIFNIKVFNDVKSMLKSDGINKIDICFIDVVLQNDEGGFFVAKYIKGINYHTLLIFISGYDDYYSKMVQVEPFRFLHKPFSKTDVINVFKEAYSRVRGENILIDTIDYFKYTYNGITFRIDIKMIKYFCSFRRKILLHDKYNNVYEFYEKLDNVEFEVNNINDSFIRINKSYLINMDFIQSYNKTHIVIDDQIFVISPKYKEIVLRKLSLQ